MIILLTQFVIAAFGLVCLACEVSDKYRDCKWHVSVRLMLMLASIILAFKVTALSALPLILQLVVLGFTVWSAKFLYKRVLKRQIRIKNFKLKKLYLGEKHVLTKR